MHKVFRTVLDLLVTEVELFCANYRLRQAKRAKAWAIRHLAQANKERDEALKHLAQGLARLRAAQAANMRGQMKSWKQN